MDKVTPVGKISKNEALKSLRDISLGAVAYMIPYLLELIPTIDFGQYTSLVAVLLTVATPFINRYCNLWRIQ